MALPVKANIKMAPWTDEKVGKLTISMYITKDSKLKTTSRQK